MNAVVHDEEMLSRKKKNARATSPWGRQGDENDEEEYESHVLLGKIFFLGVLNMSWSFSCAPLR